MRTRAFGIGILFGILLGVSLIGYLYSGFKNEIEVSDESEFIASELQIDKLELQTLDGDDFNIDTLKGKKFVLTFWATWCKPCLAEMKEMNDLNNKNILIIAVSNQSFETIESYKNKTKYNILFLRSKKSLSSYKVTSLPTTYFYSNNFKLIESVVGKLNNTEIESKFNSLSQ